MLVGVAKAKAEGKYKGKRRQQGCKLRRSANSKRRCGPGDRTTGRHQPHVGLSDTDGRITDRTTVNQQVPFGAFSLEELNAKEVQLISAHSS
jgi:hypothetical protein